MVENILLIIVGFFLLIKGADILVEGSCAVAKKFHIPEIIVGLTIVSIGTSMPELMVSVTSAVDNLPDLALGNVVGSNLCNMLLILGLSAVIRPIEFKKETKLVEIPMTLIIIFTLFILGNNGDVDKFITRPEGFILVILFICFLSYTIIMAKFGNDFDEVEEKKESDSKPMSVLKSIVFILAGIVALKFGGDFVVDNAVAIAKVIGISEKVISLTIIAIGTSLPELLTSVTAAVKGDSDIAIGNVVGSNIFNILLILGLSAAISPVHYAVSYNIDMMVMFVATALLMIFPYIGKKNTMTRTNGIIYLFGYGAYMVSLFIR
ncbi:MAG: calcium/sodium antiporter [Clostridia bacterium]|nr:calcium/sodium antiporter [Clostridia bacterium]